MPPPKKAEPSCRMVLTTNSLRNTTIAVEDDSHYYEVVTRFWHPHLTKILKLDMGTRDMVLAAEIEREPDKDVRVRFGGEHGEWIREQDFLKWDVQKRGGVFTGGEGESAEYRWKSHRRRLQLVKADDDAKVPLVQYQIYRRHFLAFRMSRHASSKSSQKRLIVSYLLVERRRRDTQTFRNYL
ncbi:hypothetical protein EDB86DRAFT_3065752 [Lactarius hatsudake]|nr:hypothetical protein EDB86DRAFT_3065752 [Lactarius hatsudake]